MHRIFYVIDSFAIGGAQTQLLQLLQRIDKTKFQVAICPIWPLLDLEPSFKAAGIEIVRVHKNFPLDLSEAWRLGIAIKKFEADIVHTWLFTGSLWGRLGAWLAKAPIIITSERSFVTENYYSPVLGLINKAFATYTDVITANSTFGTEFLIKKGYPPDKMQTIFNGVDTDTFSPVVANNFRMDARKKLDLPASSVAIGMVGRLVTPKNQAVLIEAMYKLFTCGYDDVHLILVGDGPDREKLEKATQDLGIEARVHFTGMRRNIPEILSGMDIFALSSRWEGMPNVILEAMAMGLPVVTTDVAGTSDLVQNDINGFLVPVDDVEKTAECLKKLIDSPTLRIWMGKNARSRCEKEYSLDSMVCRTTKLYEDLIKSKRLHDHE
jgi:glycosyltransferase involved in cell wall biosynthesis